MKKFIGALLALVLAAPSAWAAPLLFQDFQVQGQITNSATLAGETYTYTDDFAFGLESGAVSLLYGSVGDESAFAGTGAYAGFDSFSLLGVADAMGGQAINSSSWLITFVVASSLELLFDWNISNASMAYSVTRNGEFVGSLLDSILFQPGDLAAIDVSAAAFSPGGEYNFGWTATAVPEPGTLALLGIGLLGFALVRRQAGVSA
jgi:hypothetical protein